MARSLRPAILTDSLEEPQPLVGVLQVLSAVPSGA